MLTGSHPMRVQTCWAYASSIQASRSPHQSVEREVLEVEAGRREGGLFPLAVDWAWRGAWSLRSIDVWE